MTLKPTTRIEKPGQAAEHLIRLAAASKSFLGFVQLHHPLWNLTPFQLRLIDVLDKLEKGTLTHNGMPCYRVLINWPPRHAKSTFAAHLFIAYCIARDPRRATLSCAYNQILADDFGQKVRDYASHPFTLQAFGSADPDLALAFDKRTSARDFWRTTLGGQVAHVGIDGTTTGRPANILLIDDPIKGRQEAESPTYRNRTWDFYTGSLVNRKEPDQANRKPIEIVIHTRWHPDDLGGRIMATADFKNGEWLHLEESAIIDENTPNEKALWPTRFSLEDLHRLKRLNARDFAALYQQRPFIAGGNILKSGWWRYFNEPDAAYPIVIIAADTASKTKELNDFSVLMTLAMTGTGDIHVLDLLRGKWEFPDLRRQFISLNSRWRGKGLRAIYVEDKSSGTQIVQSLKSESGLSVIPHKVVFDKVSRAIAVTPMLEGGRVYLPNQAPWLDDFVQECEAFGPGARHDDQVDALVIGLDVLSRIPVSLDLDMAVLPFASSNLRHMARNYPQSINAQIKFRPRALGQ